MLRRLHPEQPEGFAFTPANLGWARRQIAKYPEGRQAGAVIAPDYLRRTVLGRICPSLVLGSISARHNALDIGFGEVNR